MFDIGDIVKLKINSHLRHKYRLGDRVYVIGEDYMTRRGHPYLGRSFLLYDAATLQPVKFADNTHLWVTTSELEHV